MYISVKTKNKGSALMTTVIILGLVLGVGVVVSGILIAEININKDMGDALVAIYAADTGIEETLYDIRINENFPIDPVSAADTPLWYRGTNVYSGTHLCGTLIPGCTPNYQTAHADVSISLNDSDFVGLNSVGNFKETYRAFEVTQPKF